MLTLDRNSRLIAPARHMSRFAAPTHAGAPAVSPEERPEAKRLGVYSTRRDFLAMGGKTVLAGATVGGLGSLLAGGALAQDAGYSVIRAVRLHLGDNADAFAETPEYQAPFEGMSIDLSFACPSVDSDEMSVLMFESYGVDGGPSQMYVNGAQLSAALRRTPDEDVPIWAANTVLIDVDVLRSSGNVLRIESDGDDFILDNIVIFYQTN